MKIETAFEKFITEKSNLAYNLRETLLSSIKNTKEQLATCDDPKDVTLDLHIYEMTFIISSILDCANFTRKSLAADPVMLSSHFKNVDIGRLRNHFHHNFSIPKNHDEKLAIIKGLLEISENLGNLLDGSLSEEDKREIEFSSNNVLLKHIDCCFKDSQIPKGAFTTSGTFYTFCISFPKTIYEVVSYEKSTKGLQSDLNGKERFEKFPKKYKAQRALTLQDNRSLTEAPKNFLNTLHTLKKSNQDGKTFFENIPAIDEYLDNLKSRITTSLLSTLNQNSDFKYILDLESYVNTLDSSKQETVALKKQIDESKKILSELQRNDITLYEINQLVISITNLEKNLSNGTNLFVLDKILEKIHEFIQTETPVITNILSQKGHEDDKGQRDLLSNEFSKISRDSRLSQKEDLYYKEEFNKGLEALHTNDIKLYSDLVDNIITNIEVSSSDNYSITLSTCIKQMLDFEDRNGINILRKALIDALYRDFNRVHHLTQTLRLSIELDNQGNNNNFDQKFSIAAMNIFASINASRRFTDNLSKLTDDKDIKEHIEVINQSLNIRDRSQIKGLPLDKLTFFELISSFGIGPLIALFRHYCEDDLDESLGNLLRMVYDVLKKTPYCSDPSNLRGLAGIFDKKAAGNKHALKIAQLITSVTPHYDSMAKMSSTLQTRLNRIILEDTRDHETFTEECHTRSALLGALKA